MAAALSNMIPDRLSQRFELAHHPPTSKIAPVGPVRILIDGFSVACMPRRAPSNRAPHGQGAGLARSQMFEIPGCHGATHHSFFFDGKGTGGKPRESNQTLTLKSSTVREIKPPTI